MVDVSSVGPEIVEPPLVAAADSAPGLSPAHSLESPLVLIVRKAVELFKHATLVIMGHILALLVSCFARLREFFSGVVALLFSFSHASFRPRPAWFVFAPTAVDCLLASSAFETSSNLWRAFFELVGARGRGGDDASFATFAALVCLPASACCLIRTARSRTAVQDVLSEFALLAGFFLGSTHSGFIVDAEPPAFLVPAVLAVFFYYLAPSLGRQRVLLLAGSLGGCFTLLVSLHLEWSPSYLFFSILYTFDAFIFVQLLFSRGNASSIRWNGLRLTISSIISPATHQGSRSALYLLTMKHGKKLDGKKDSAPKEKSHRSDHKDVQHPRRKKSKPTHKQGQSPTTKSKEGKKKKSRSKTSSSTGSGDLDILDQKKSSIKRLDARSFMTKATQKVEEVEEEIALPLTTQ